MDILRISIWFLIGYFSVTLFRLLHFYYLYRKYVKENHSELGKKDLNGKIFRKNFFYMPFVYLTIWLVNSYFFFSHYSSGSIVLDGLLIGILWLFVSILVDFIIFYLAKNRLHLTIKDVYVATQPWISLSYYTVLISPLIFSYIIQ